MAAIWYVHLTSYYPSRLAD